MKVLAGGPTRETESDLFKLHCDSLEAQAWPGVEITLRHETVTDIGGPKWHNDKIERVARARQKMLNMLRRADGRSSKYDALFMVDTDVVVGPGVLKRMIGCDADVVYGVFWTYWEGFQEPQPQVWDTHPFGHSPAMKKALRTMDPLKITEYPVLAGGACTLIRNRGFESRYHPRLQSLVNIGEGMWPGEDRTYCIGLEARGIKQIAVFGLPIRHLDTPPKQTPEHIAIERERMGL